MTLEVPEELPDLLAGRRVACAESFTAGRVAASLASVEGASTWFAGGLVAYQEIVKRQWLGVEAPSVITRQAAGEMAVGVCRLLGVDVAVATTGVAGDEPVDGVAPGTVILATIVSGDLRTCELMIEGSPEAVCEEGSRAAVAALCDHLRRV